MIGYIPQKMINGSIQEKTGIHPNTEDVEMFNERGRETALGGCAVAPSSCAACCKH